MTKLREQRPQLRYYNNWEVILTNTRQENFSENKTKFSPKKWWSVICGNPRTQRSSGGTKGKDIVVSTNLKQRYTSCLQHLRGTLIFEGNLTQPPPEGFEYTVWCTLCGRVGAPLALLLDFGLGQGEC